jgi:type VI secretion system secreted protein Hcp
MWKAALLVAVGAAGGATALAVAAIPDNGVIHACYPTVAGGAPASTANLRIIDPSAGQTCSTAVGAGPAEAALNWNQAGPPGPPGANGATGATGSPGAPGKSVTIPAGGTLTLAGGTVLNVGQASGVTVIAPPLRKLVPSQTGVTLTGNGPTIHFEMLSLAFATHSGGSGSIGGGGATGKATVHDITVTKTHDSSSPKLFLACAKGSHFKQVTITLAKHGKSVVYKLSDVYIPAVQVGAFRGDEPTEALTFNYSSIHISY